MEDNRMTINGNEYEVVCLLGKGKGGYSYLVTDRHSRYVLKQIHHEPCEYYTFGDKLESELNDYETLRKTGITMPKLLAVDEEKERLLKEYIQGDTVYELVKTDRMEARWIEKMQDMCKLLYPANLNIDYFPTNFIPYDGELYYIDYQKTLSGQSPERAKNFKRAVMLTGVNDSSKENKFISGAYKLSSGEHLNENDKNKILMHKDLAEKNNLKIGDKIKIKSNLFDADNEKGANEEVEVEIKGLFDGHNEGGVTVAQELYENTLITDLDTAAKVYGNTEDTAVYQDATFFVKGDKNLDKVIKNIEKLDIDWQQYNLIKSSNNYPALQQSISGIYKIANKLFAGSLLFAGVTVSLLLFLWMNARKKEIAILLSLGISKAKIFGQFVIELVFVSIPAFIGSYFLAVYTASMIGNNILSKVTGTIAKQIAKQGESSQLGGGAEVDGFNKTLTSLEINISPKLMIYVILFMSIVLIISLLISSSRNLRKSPKELLIDTK